MVYRQEEMVAEIIRQADSCPRPHPRCLRVESGRRQMDGCTAHVAIMISSSNIASSTPPTQILGDACQPVFRYSARTLERVHGRTWRFGRGAGAAALSRIIILMLRIVQRTSRKSLRLWRVTSTAGPECRTSQILGGGTRLQRSSPRPRIPGEEVSFGDPATFPLWEQAIKSNVVVSVLANPPHLPTLANLAERFPQVNIVVDHYADPDVRT